MSSSISSRVKMEATEIDLALFLLRYIIISISRQLIAKEIWTYTNIPEFLDTSENRLKQFEAEAGAILCSEFTTAFSFGCRCLEQWGVVDEIRSDFVYKLNISAANLDELKTQGIDFNKELYASAVENFFSIHYQSPFGSFQYSKESPLYIKVDETAPDLFIRAGLVVKKNGKLFWASNVLPYLQNSEWPEWPVESMNWDGQLRPAEAHEFFEEICS